MLVIVKTVKVSAKGQITLPAETLRSIRARKGTELVLVQEGDRIILVKAANIGRAVADEAREFGALATRSFEKLWDNPEDEIWNEYA